MMGNKGGRVIAGTAPHSLCVLAGFPRSIIQTLQGTVQNSIANWRVIITAFPENDGAIYQSEAAITDLMRQVCKLGVERVIKNEDNPLPAPKRIVLCYVEAPNHQNLLSSFGHSLLPIRLEIPEWSWDSGKHWRKFLRPSTDAVLRALVSASSSELAELKLQLEAARTSDAITLPGRNFKISKDNFLSGRFQAALSGDIPWSSIGDDLCLREFNHENLGSFFSRVTENKKRFYVDDRELVFPLSKSGQHGFSRELESTEDLSRADMRRWLEGIFRFGTPFRSGFQHDVQYEGGKRLEREPFNCAEKGIMEATGSHANVYANDVVREA